MSDFEEESNQVVEGSSSVFIFQIFQLFRIAMSYKVKFRIAY